MDTPQSTQLKFPAPITYLPEGIKPNSTNKKASGFYNELNQEQYEALQKFKQFLIQDNVVSNLDLYDDLYLLRFLRARKFDLSLTMTMFKNFLEWRIKEKVDDIRENFEFTEMFDVKKFYPHSYHKTDRTGRPIYIELISQIKLEDLFKYTTDERMTKYYIREYERLMQRRFPACSAAVGQPVEQSLTIMDVNGIGITSLFGRTKAFLQLATKIGQDYYPEMLGTMLLLNTGFFFRGVWSIIKGFIDEKTAKKINLLGGNYTDQLFQFADPENVPTCIGGKCTCPQIEGGCLYSDIGPWNPKGGIKIGDHDTYIGNK